MFNATIRVGSLSGRGMSLSSSSSSSSSTFRGFDSIYTLTLVMVGNRGPGPGGPLAGRLGGRKMGGKRMTTRKNTKTQNTYYYFATNNSTVSSTIVLREKKIPKHKTHIIILPPIILQFPVRLF